MASFRENLFRWDVMRPSTDMVAAQDERWGRGEAGGMDGISENIREGFCRALSMLAILRVAGLFGAPKAAAIWDGFYAYLTQAHSFAPKAVPEGRVAPARQVSQSVLSVLESGW